jgi:hypothetical protein
MNWSFASDISIFERHFGETTKERFPINQGEAIDFHCDRMA